MSFPIHIHQLNGHFTATLVGVPDVSVIASTREEALAKMEAAIQKRMVDGELVLLDVPARRGIMAIAGMFKDDESLTEICAEIYRQRDAEPKE